VTIKTVILCGGLGTRIRDVADDIPKPLIRIGERPVLWHIMKTYAYYGLKDFVLCLGYKGWLIKEFFLNYHHFVTDFTLTLDSNTGVQYHSDHSENDWRITMANTGLHTQTGGRIWRVREYLEDSDIFCVTYGDGVADIDVNALLDFHRSHGLIGTVTGVRPPGRFGVMEIEDDDSVPIATSFREKPQGLTGYINGGYFVFDHRLWDFLADDPNLVFEHAPLSGLAEAGELAVYKHQAFWQPMDTFRDWRQLNAVWDSGEAPWQRP
jgi:glucose-1-phosphate cytidylyltransferase